MSTTQGIKLDDSVRTRLKALGQKRDRSPHWLMKAAIEDYLEREERYEQEKAEDLERWERYQHTGIVVDGPSANAWLQDLADGNKSPCPQ